MSQLLAKRNVLILCLLLGSSCGKLKNMEKRTKNMESMSSQILAQSNKSGAQIDNSMLLQRKKNASESREMAWNNMIEAKSFARKVNLAAKYYKAFEYQTWTGVGHDTEEYRDILIEDAAAEYFRNIQELKEQIGSKEIKPSSNDTYVLSFYALAVAMHKNHYKQKHLEITIQENNKDIGSQFFHLNANFEEKSMYDLIKNALKFQAKENTGTADGNKKPYMKEILDHQEDAELLVNSRYEMLMAMSLAKVSDIKKPGWLKLFRKGKMRFFKWKSKFPKLNLSQQETVLKYLEVAQKAKSFLEVETNTEIKLNTSLRKIFERMKIKEDNANIACETCTQNVELFKQRLDENLK